jgi:hypothetical protein
VDIEVTIAAMERTYTAPRLDKLGVKPGHRVALVGLDGDPLVDELRTRTDDITFDEPLADTDLVFLAADSTEDLGGLVQLRTRLRPNGAIWIVSRKGKAATLRYDELLAVAKAAGLVDNKVVGFDETRTSLRFVIPVAMRPKP